LNVETTRMYTPAERALIGETQLLKLLVYFPSSPVDIIAFPKAFKFSELL